ncbi:MAG: nucleoid-structuring protein H-NS [Reichenbachiella sp.]|uniref:nucleoid-structuring protein H-NS n=1 Tax=Reichenbachiella sp. TaxID=2184521 RepID=UPI002966C4B8|nr:nucleoid-structuring protein H-NS [Reichenbachiella sp.]MDW3210659.1 nucleoid-structuring protein H-NS [Reichenbachiella sp.]
MTKNTLNIIPVALVVALMIGTSSCKTKKNLAQVTPVEEVEPVEDEVVEELEEVTEEVVEERVPEKILSKEQKLNNYFSAVSGASSTSVANNNIDQALGMFSNPDAPVLIVIYNDGANPDYDEPTTISKYLNYLKDTKTKAATVEEVVYDSQGRIKELVLKK